jgi:hypothetical protein
MRAAVWIKMPIRPASQCSGSAVRSGMGALMPVSRLSGDHGVRFPNGAAFVAGSFQGFVGDFRPEFFQRWCFRLVRVPFGFIRGPWHLIRLP